MSKRKTLKEWQEESNIIHKNEFVILEEPKSGSHNVPILHKKCGNIISMKLNNHTKRYCTFCSGKNKKSLEQYQEKSNFIHNGEYRILENPINVKNKVKILHNKCGGIFEITMNNHINHKQKCRLCGTNSRKSNDYWLERSREIWGTDYTILDYIETVHHKVEILHNICGRKHKKNMNSFIHGERGCPFCTKDLKYSEKYITDYLTNKSIRFETEKTFDDLINPKTGRKLRYDFYLPDLNIIIETHGVQHYKPIEHWHGEKGYEEQVYRDRIKEEYLKEKEIKYIVLNNKELTKIKEIV
jgi:hypothetical protein